MSEPWDEVLPGIEPLGNGPESIDTSIRHLEKRIAEGINVHECKRLKRALLRNAMDTASWGQHIPTAPPSLEQQRLQQLYNAELYDAEDLKNYTAVVHDYEIKEITHPPNGQVYFYYRGVRVTDMVTLATFQLHENAIRWAGEHGIGKIWAEGGVEAMLMQMAAAGTIAPHNVSQQHMMTARVQTDGPFADISFLDDIGANVMSLYEMPDLALLGVGNGSPF